MTSPAYVNWETSSQRQASPRGNEPDCTTRLPSGQHRQRKKFILCFDGTGNKFSGTDSDSNILKIYRMLDRHDNSQFHYYQPGIGTYVDSKSWSHTSHIDRLKSWYAKAKDSAVGTSFGEHVMGGYKFLMRYYIPGDDIYLFGFSRGAYTARFLAEMLDHVGLLSAGNEEMCRFAWKTFQKWQCRQERTEEEKKEKKYLLDYMCAFRETFSRPVRRIRFLGLFDTVNSVPKFENAWMERSKFPYTARSSAKVIRHAVSIDERRAKFRQDLISGSKPKDNDTYRRRRQGKGSFSFAAHEREQAFRGRQESDVSHWNYEPHRNNLNVPERFRDHSETAGIRNLSPGFSDSKYESGRLRSAASSTSNASFNAMAQHPDLEDSDGEDEQDILEVWFAGCHADIGGGWPLSPGEDSALSHVTLVWMVREAQRAGLNFDEVKLRNLNCSYDEPPQKRRPTTIPIPEIEIDPASPGLESGVTKDIAMDPVANGVIHRDEAITDNHATGSDSDTHLNPHHPHKSRFHKILHTACTQSRIHDVLQFKNGATATSVISWNIMEYMPFRRMDLQSDGTWKSITWPLPKGEVRDIPENAIIHNSVIKRMEHDPEYRPGNLIVGGGGRGVRKAPADYGMGKWVVYLEPGDPVGEAMIRAAPVEKKKEENEIRPIGKAVEGS